MGLLPHSVTVKIDDYLDAGVLVKNLLDFRLRQVIRHAPVQFPVHHVVNAFMMNRLNSILIVEKIRQQVPHPHNGGALIPRHRVREGLLRVGMVDQYFRAFL